jgi:two-component system cell cycle sensor histidine kinase/response regulator CckA
VTPSDGEGGSISEPVDVHAVIGLLAPILRRRCGPSVELEMALSAGRSVVVGDAGRIEQVLVNLVLNACDAMPDGGRLTIATENVDGEDSVEVTVWDTGVGMDDATKEHALKPLFTTKSGSMGLGLSVALGVVEGMGGTLSIESAPGRGSTVRVRIPLAKTAITAREER